MKKLVYLFLLITQVFFAQSGFETGNALYKKGQYEQAIDAYNTVLGSKMQSAELYYNIANCYYKLNKVAPAIYNYEKALILSPNNTDVINNLKFAQKRTVDEVKVIPKVGFEKLLRDFTAIYNYDKWAWLAITFSVLFLLGFIGYYFSAASVLKRVFFVSMFLMLVFVLISVSAAMFEKNYAVNERPAIVFADRTEVKSEPRNKGNKVIDLHEGTKVYVKKVEGRWKKVQLTDGTMGWIDSEAIREVK
ncbi:tetratricopeptide repeat protein [Flavobacterium sp. F-380]|uniref:Tetratricopeptide repeat protein n=1 Tax=Flavobacterium kayseriense TaxID=2764714 RepID=A0ABR7J579_9FLAO|nr:tetratricopeptide repeat protein [Flavobacterium kayseriense]MBC5840367.1 tetratricopeptide repeat protein [Flavobacterium kayseriense]MBC5846963.1 tetratricopeptide repeat protein [Flavobacterium kayseriense]